MEQFNQQNFGRMSVFDNRIIGISPQFFKTCDDNYVNIAVKDESNSLDPVSNLYSEAGIGTSITSEFVRNQLAVDIDFDDTFQVKYKISPYDKGLKFRIDDYNDPNFIENN